MESPQELILGTSPWGQNYYTLFLGGFNILSAGQGMVCPGAGEALESLLSDDGVDRPELTLTPNQSSLFPS